MNRETLEIFLPAFMIVFFAIVTLWAYFRRRRIRQVISKTEVYKRVQAIDVAFKVMLICSMFIVFVYSYFPEHYSLFAPIDFLDHPIVNTIGVLILKISLAWTVIAQLTIDKSVFMINAGVNEWSYNRLLLYSEKLLLSGMLVMFIGFFVTISSGVTILISLVGLFLYKRILRFQSGG